MYQRFRNSITNPKVVFFYIKDSFSRVLSYILLMGIILSIPMFIKSFVNKNDLYPSKEVLNEQIRKNMFTDDMKVENNRLIKSNDKISINFSIDNYTYVVGVIPNDAKTYLIIFESDAIRLYTNAGNQFTMPISEVMYANDFNFNEEGINEINSMLMTLINDNDVLFITNLLSFYFASIIELIFLALMLSLMAVIFKKLPLPFKAHFKVAIYLLTPWVILTTIFTLYGLEILSLLAIVVAYIYHLIAYNSVRIVNNKESRDNNEK